MVDTKQDHLLSNSTYDILKRLVTFYLPALAVLYAVLSAVWDLPSTEVVLVILATLATLGGFVLNTSSKSWDYSDAKYDGDLVITGDDPDTTMPNITLNIRTDPNELMEQSMVLLKSVDLRG
jgi:Putative phage holin Dp-1